MLSNHMTKDQIAKLEFDHKQFWEDVSDVQFWTDIRSRYVVKAANCETVDEILARYKIVPMFKEFNELFTEALNSDTIKRDNLNHLPAIEFLDTLFEKLNEVDRTSVKMNKYDNEEFIKEKIVNKQRELLVSEFHQELDKRVIELLFPRHAVFKLQDIFMQLQDGNRNTWSERTYDNTLYAAIFQRYFKDNFGHLGDQKINKYLPDWVKNDTKSDLMLISRSYDVPFLICEYGKLEDSSNCQDCIKLIETLQRVLTKRAESYAEHSNSIFGVLCAGDKLTLLHMKYGNDGYFNCYFIATNKNELQTLRLELANIGTILKMNIILKIAGVAQYQRVSRSGREKKSTITTKD